MRARVEASAFAAAVKAAAPATKGAHVESLHFLRLAASDDSIEVVGGNGDMYLSTDVSAAVETAGTITVPAAALARLAPTFAGALVIEAIDGDLVLLGDNGQASLRLGDANNYPILDWPTDDPIPLGGAWARIGAIAYAMSLDPDGHSIRLMRFGDGEALATDRYRGARTAIPDEVPVCWAPREAVTTAIKTLGDQVSMVATERMVGWTDKTTTIMSSQAQPEGDWRPGITRMIEDKRSVALRCDAAELSDAVRAVAALEAEEKLAPTVSLAMRDGELEISRTNKELGAARRTVAAEGEVPPWLAIQSSYLRDALVAIDGEVRIEAVDHRKAVRLYGADGIDQIVMPVRVAGAPK